MARTSKDKFANLMNAALVTNGVTVVSDEVATGVSIGEGKGLLVDQIDYFLDGTIIADFIAAAAGEALRCTWSVQTGEFGYNNSRVLHEMDLTKWADAAPTSSSLDINPKVFQFFPPLIVAAPKLFFNCEGAASITGGTVQTRLYFRYVDLTTQEYLELAESFTLMS